MAIEERQPVPRLSPAPAFPHQIIERIADDWYGRADGEEFAQALLRELNVRGLAIGPLQ